MRKINSGMCRVATQKSHFHYSITSSVYVYYVCVGVICSATKTLRSRAAVTVGTW